MRVKTILCLLLGLYSLGIGVYALSELYSAQSCPAGCFKGENPFKDGTSGTRDVNVQFRASGPNGFGADPAKITGALTTAMGNWNAATDGTNTTPYHFQGAQSGPPASNVNIEIILVDDIKGAPRNACMQLVTWKDPTSGNVAGGRLYVRRSSFNNADQTQLAELIQHELGHFIGLADYYANPDQCETTMAQAKDDCKGLKGSRTISQSDVSQVKKYVAHSTDCDKPRQSTPVLDTGGYVDPTPVYYYPYTCYYYYSAYDIYYSCDCRENGQYAFTIYTLDDVICF